MRLMRPAATAALTLAAMVLTVVSSAARADTASLPATQICEPLSIAYDVNDSGTVAGYLGSWPITRAAVCSADGELSYLPAPDDATGSIAVAINSVGQVAGQITLTSGGQEAVIWNTSSGVLTRLGFLPGGLWSSAQDINDNGWVVGVAGAAGTFQGFLVDGSGVMKPLPMPSGASSSYAQAINNEGTVVGGANVMNAPGLAVMWKDGAAIALPPLADGATASAADINDAGQIVGNSATTAPPWSVREAVLWDGGNVVSLGSFGGPFGLASAISADGQIAGYMSDDAAGGERGFLWVEGVLTVLDPLAGDEFSGALGMNGNGEIVGYSSLGESSAARWTEIADTTPPDLNVSVTPNMLWPPNHQYATVKATVAATDDTDPSPVITLVSVTSNEPDNGEDDGNTVDDIVIVNDTTFDLRAERSGVGSGRIYTITYTATDASGNSTTQSATVIVPLEW